MAAEHRLHNAGPYPLVIDSEGHLLDVDDVLVGNPNGVILRRLIESGQLTDLGPAGELPSEVPDPPDPEKAAPAPTTTKKG